MFIPKMDTWPYLPQLGPALLHRDRPAISWIIIIKFIMQGLV